MSMGSDPSSRGRPSEGIWAYLIEALSSKSADPAASLATTCSVLLMAWQPVVYLEAHVVHLDQNRLGVPVFTYLSTFKQNL